MLSHSRAQGVAHARSPPLTMHNGLLHIIAEVDHFPAQVHRRQFIRGAHHPSAATVLRTVARLLASTAPANTTDTPFGS